MELPAEERLLLHLAKLAPSASDRAAAQEVLPAVDWQRALVLAHDHRVHALLASHLAAEPGVPEEARQQLARMRLTAELHNERYARALAPVLAELDGPVLLLKGARVRGHAIVKDSLIGWGSTIGRWAYVQDCVFGEDVAVKDGVLVHSATVLPHNKLKDSIRPSPTGEKKIVI